MSGGDASNNPFALGNPAGAELTPGGFFSTQKTWGQKATGAEATATSGKTNPLFRPSIFGQQTAVENSQSTFGSTSDIQARSTFAPNIFERPAGKDTKGATAGSGSFPIFGASDNVFGQPKKPTLLNEEKPTTIFGKAQTEPAPSIFAKTFFGSALGAKVLPASDGFSSVQTAQSFGGSSGIFGKVGEPKKDPDTFGVTEPKPPHTITSGIFGKALQSTADEQKKVDAIFGKIQTKASIFGPSIFGSAQDANKEKEKQIDPPSTFGHANVFGKPAESGFSNVKKTKGNIFQENADRQSPNIFAMASGGFEDSNDETVNFGGRQVDPRSSSANPFVREIKQVHQIEGAQSHPRDPRTAARPGIFTQALGDVLKEAPSKIDSTKSASPVVIQTLFSLYISDVPSELFDKSTLMEHFSQFGKVTKILLSPARKSCSVKFENHETAEKAKTHGAQIGNTRLHIFWAKAGSLGHSERRPLKSLMKGGEGDGLRSKPQKDKLQTMKKTKVTQRESSAPRLYDLEDDVQAELNSMLLPNTSSFSSKLPPAPQPKEPRGAKLVPRPIATLSRSKRRSSPLSLREATAPKPAAAAAEDVTLNISHASMDELTKVMRSPAHSAEERYRVLEARDKLMRMKRVRQSDLAKARLNCGTCPDMCPEKERYHREFQRQVAAYELAGAPGKMDHAAAVKQYSRSSADQEEPLSHELRPAAALRLTMDYLMWKLMDICDNKDENMADWYHYIWDRTRGIRKDITQQELSDESSVELVEQCARWHIFCSERLIAEDLMIYDDNINTENLTKCLQTLKYMYLDLSLKGISCPNEAEFRAYFVMLNLNEGDCMWEVQQLSSEIRESAPVRFALQVSTALASNNYIRFFKLVRSSTYLNACILHRYFAQVRSQALQTMVRAFCSRAKETVFSLEEVVSLAGFEDTREAALLCSYHGLRLAEDGASVVFSRNTFYLPDTAVPAARVLSLVDAKRDCSVGAVVSGGGQPRTDFQTHRPHDSFDGSGVLKLAAWNARDQEKDGTAAAAAGDGEDVADYAAAVAEGREEGEIVESQRLQVDSEAVMRTAIRQHMQANRCEQVLKEVVDAVVNTEICNIVEAEMKNAFVENATDAYFFDIINAVTEEMVSAVCNEEVRAAIAAREEQLRQERLEVEAEMLRKMREKRFQQELDSYLDEFILECVEQAVSDERELEEWLAERTSDLVEQFVAEECHLLARESVAAARLIEVNRIHARSRKRELKRCFKQWQDFVTRSKLRTQSMADFPAWMSNLSLDEQAASLPQPDPYLIENMNRARYASNKSKLHALEREPPPVPTLDLADAVSVQLSARMKEQSCHDAYLYWKLVTSGPDATEAPHNSRLIKSWTDQLFSLDAETSMRTSRASPNSYETVTACVQSVTGHAASNADKWPGVDGILLWVSHKEASLVGARRRLSTVLAALREAPAVPVAVVLTGPLEIGNKQIHKELDLVSLRATKRVSYFKVFARARTGGSVRGLRRQVEVACQWLAELAPPPSPLTVAPMRRLMSRCLIDELWSLVKPTRKIQDPNSMIELYNKALLRVKDMLCGKSLSEYSLGAPEFKKFLKGDSQHEQRQFHVAPSYWESREYYAFIGKIISNAEMPVMETWPPKNNADLKEVLVQYCESQGLPQVVSSVFQLIEQQARIRHRLSYPPVQPTDWQSFLKSISWCSVIEIIVEAKLESLAYSFDSSATDEFQVVFHRQSFKVLQTWLIEHLYILDLAESTSGVCGIEEKIGQKRSIEEDLPMPSKQRKLSLVEIYSNIKASLNRLDSTMSSVKKTWQEIDKEMSNE